MRRLHTVTIGLGLAALLAGPAAAQQPAPPEGGTGGAPPHRMGMPGMMAACADHATLKTDVAAALAKVRTARTGSDPAAATTALADAERTLAAVQAHFSTCEARMEHMGKMDAMKDKMKGAPPAPKADEHTH